MRARAVLQMNGIMTNGFYKWLVRLVLETNFTQRSELNVFSFISFDFIITYNVFEKYRLIEFQFANKICLLYCAHLINFFLNFTTLIL